MSEVKAQIAQDEKMGEEGTMQGGLTGKERGRIGVGLNEIKEMVTDIVTGVDVKDLSPSDP